MNEDFYISLIYKQLDDELSATELIQLSGWLASNSENKALADDLKAAYEASDDYLLDEMEDIDVDAAFAHQMELIGAEEVEEEHKIPSIEPKKESAKIVQMQSKNRPSGLYRYLSVAAAVVVLVVAGWWFSDFGENNSANPQMVETTNEAKEFTLSDGSVVSLGKDSEIKIGDFNDKNRLVKLVKGAARFSVTKDKGTFVVDSKSGSVTVLGTIFNVTTKENSLRVEVEEGKVRVNPSTTGYINSDVKVELTAQEAVEFSNGTFIKWNKADNTKRFEFKNVNVKTITTFLEKHYNVSIEVNENLENCQMTYIFKAKTLEEILKTIDENIGSSTSKKSNGSYEMDGKGCKENN